MRLTKQQVKYFQTFGYLLFQGILKNEISKITNGFEKIWDIFEESNAGIKHDKKQRTILVPFIDQDEYLSAMLDNDTIDGIAASLLGDDYNYTTSDGGLYVGDTGWHSDGWLKTKYLTIKMAIYLDSVTNDTGCLRVIPGSHHVGTFADALHETSRTSKEQNQEELWGIKGVDVPAIALESKPGDLVVFAHRIQHSSFGGGNSRRMFTINFEKRHLDKDVSILKNDMVANAIGGKRSIYWSDRAYGKIMVDTASTSRMRHLEQRLANDDHLADLIAKAKAEISEPSGM
mgnify:CR=1 FL=1